MKTKKNPDDKLAQERFFKALSTISTPALARDFFEDLCTPAELQAMVDRWQVVHMLNAGKTYRQIQDETGISVTTVGRVARALQTGNGGYAKVFKLSEQE